MRIYSKYIRSEFDYDQPLCCLFGLAAIRLGHVASSSSLIRHSASTVPPDGGPKEGKSFRVGAVRYCI
jgi:hypothetical protein